MAWMKIDLELPDKPEVHAIAGILGIDPDAVVGKLIRVWQWFDKHTTDGNAVGVTFALPNRISGVLGFGEAMAQVGWLEQRDNMLVMPKFDAHTSESAKARALTAKRVEKHKAKGNAKVTETVTVSPLAVALPKEEKEKEEKQTHTTPVANAPSVTVSKPSKPKSDDFDPRKALIEVAKLDPSLADDFLRVRKAKRAPVTKTALNGISAEAQKAGWSFEQAIRACCENNWQGFKAEWVEGKAAPHDSSKPKLSREQYEAKRAARLAELNAQYGQMQAEWTVPVVGLTGALQ